MFSIKLLRLIVLIILVGIQILFLSYYYKGSYGNKLSFDVDVIPLITNFKIPKVIKKWNFQNFTLLNWKISQSIVLKSDNLNYFKRISPDVECFVEGTDWTHTKSEKCICKKKYFGRDCGIPDSVWFGHYSSDPTKVNQLNRRETPRRLIQGLLFNHEFEMLEIRMGSSYDVVDAFVIQESNYSSIGDPKPLNLLYNLSKGWLYQYQTKIIYVPLLYFNTEWHSNGWLIEDESRNHLSLQGLPLIQNKADDDLFLLFDADEIPSRSALLFLKLYNGISEPIQFGMRWNLYGFFWLKSDDLSSEKLLKIFSGVTLGMLKKVYDNKAILIRSNAHVKPSCESKASKYAEAHSIETLTIGAIGYYGGVHCSWCFRPEGIRTKLLSAQKEDKPRWGDYPEKTKIPYIASLIQKGRWFDGSYPTIRVNENDSNFAPSYAINNPTRFMHLLKLN